MSSKVNGDIPQASATSPPPVKGPPKEEWTVVAFLLWLLLGVIRGTTSVMLSLAGKDLQPTLVVLVRSPGTIGLFVGLILVWARYSTSYKDTLLMVLKQPFTWVKLAVLGIIQSGGPFLLFTYGLIHLPAAFGGAFMALTPVWAVVAERTVMRPFLKTQPGKLNALKIAGMFTIMGGIVLHILPSILKDSDSSCKANGTNSSAVNTDPQECATGSQVGLGIMELLFGSMLWGISAVYWRVYKGKIHFTVAGGGQTLFGGILALIFWLTYDKAVDKSTFTGKAIGSLLYLMILSGFCAALLLFYLYGKIGAVATARVLCIVPIVSWVEDKIFLRHSTDGLALEFIGLLVIVVGLIFFEGRLDKICGIDVPCVIKLQHKKQMKDWLEFSTNEENSSKYNQLNDPLMVGDSERAEKTVNTEVGDFDYVEF